MNNKKSFKIMKEKKIKLINSRVQNVLDFKKIFC